MNEALTLRTGIAHDETVVPQGYHQFRFLILIVCGTPVQPIALRQICRLMPVTPLLKVKFVI
ncbi:hypothetical protein INT80_13245 [Gallibacterium anatis]|uniref:Uncharacterized protein n=1 Tax=Gallibacterium anatis TaxID=750 RepID=A0A930UWY0_9PAST|nr:hypothetical protein [Gallibacterium anatis]